MGVKNLTSTGTVAKYLWYLAGPPNRWRGFPACAVGVMHNKDQSMIQRLQFIFLAILISGYACAEVENKYQSEVAHIQEVGNLLYARVKSKEKFKLKELKNYKDIKSHLAKAECGEFSYKTYLIKDQDIDLVYFVASKTFSNPVIIGRHFIAPIEDGSLNLEKFVSSTKGCLNLGSPKKATGGMFATSLDPYPNEFHVLQSKLHGITLYLGTEYAIWKIVNGEVSLMELREGA